MVSKNCYVKNIKFLCVIPSIGPINSYVPLNNSDQDQINMTGKNNGGFSECDGSCDYTTVPRSRISPHRHTGDELDVDGGKNIK